MRTTSSRSALSTTALLALVVAAAAPSCAPWHHEGDNGAGAAADLVVDGDAPALRPRISLAAASLVVRLPRPGYLTALRVFPHERSMKLLTPAEGERAASTELAAGEHRLLLRAAPVFLVSNVVRAAADRDRAARLAGHGIPDMPGPAYTLVVVTARPVSWATAQDALADVDLNSGGPREVITRIARAVGTASGGEWGAAVRGNASVW